MTPPRDISGERAIVPVVLAAGSSVRMGYPKALLPLGSTSFLDAIIDALEGAGLGSARVVLGGHAEAILPVVTRRGARPILNPDYAKGQLSSIQRALHELEAEATACLLWPVDQPAVSHNLVHRLLERWRATGAPLVLPVYQGRRGHPVVIGRTLFAELLELPVDRGAKPVIARHEAEMELVETDEEATVFDLDTPEDYRRFTGETLAAALERAARR